METETKPFTALPKRVGIFKIYSISISANVAGMVWGMLGEGIEITTAQFQKYVLKETPVKIEEDYSYLTPLLKKWNIK